MQPSYFFGIDYSKLMSVEEYLIFLKNNQKALPMSDFADIFALYHNIEKTNKDEKIKLIKFYFENSEVELRTFYNKIIQLSIAIDEEEKEVEKRKIKDLETVENPITSENMDDLKEPIKEELISINATKVNYEDIKTHDSLSHQFNEKAKIENNIKPKSPSRTPLIDNFVVNENKTEIYEVVK